MTLIEIVLGKSELKGISKEFAQKKLDVYLAEHPEIVTAYEEDPDRFPRKKECEQLKKEVRAQLREVYGVFFQDKYAAKKKKFVDALITEPTEQNANAVLSLHRSTTERLAYYSFLYQQLFQITGTPQSILDLGCGFNPFSYLFLPNRPEYHCFDIACDDLTLIDEFLTSLKVEHSTTCTDLTTTKTFPQADVAFCFKLMDSLETEQRNITKEFLDAIPAKFIVVSFATATIGQKNTIGPRQWFEDLVTDRVVGRVTLPNEQFIIITSEKSESVT